MDKSKHHTTITFTLKSTDRAAVRAEVFHHWLNEEPGSPTVRNTYRYNVEKLPDRSLIYLTRPTRLNKGADFVILCQGFTKFKNGSDKPPSHADLMSEMESMVSLSFEHRTEILSALHRIWNCESSAVVTRALTLFQGSTRAERVLLLAKWFFIEQDVTYWTESGRHMLRSFFEDRFGAFP